MNHQPFETWLLEETSLSAEERSELQSHLRECKHCSALAETEIALRLGKMAAPAPGFVSRFEKRLAAQRLADRKRRVWGAALFMFGSLMLLAWAGGPLIFSLIHSPAQWITIGIGYLVFIVTSLQTLGEAGAVLLRVIPGLIPPFVWMIAASVIAGLGLLWTVSIWRFTRSPRGV